LALDDNLPGTGGRAIFGVAASRRNRLRGGRLLHRAEASEVLVDRVNVGLVAVERLFLLGVEGRTRVSRRLHDVLVRGNERGALLLERSDLLGNGSHRSVLSDWMGQRPVCQVRTMFRTTKGAALARAGGFSPFKRF